MAFPKRNLQSSDTPEEKLLPPIRAFVATPSYDKKVFMEYSQSLAESCQHATLVNIAVNVCVLNNCAFVDMGRNILTRLFLESNATHLFFIDSDLKWEPRAFIALLTSGKPICAGSYRKRQEPEEYPVRIATGKDGTMDIRNGWIMADRVPTGFLCIERSVIEKMVANTTMIKDSKPDQPDNPRLFYTYINDESRFVGEDYAFCDDYVKQTGEHIWVWPDFDFVHQGYKGNWHDFLSNEAEKVMRGEKSDAICLKEDKPDSSVAA